MTKYEQLLKIAEYLGADENGAEVLETVVAIHYRCGHTIQESKHFIVTGDQARDHGSKEAALRLMAKCYADGVPAFSKGGCCPDCEPMSTAPAAGGVTITVEEDGSVSSKPTWELAPDTKQ